MAIPRPNPKLMAIGDSLPQGCRNLTVRASFCAQSWPARLAQAQGWNFVSPDHHAPVLFDLEEEIRRLNPVNLSPADLSFTGLPGRILTNFKHWQQQPGGSMFECFDNLAVAGAKVHDLYSQTSEECDQYIAKIAEGGLDDILRQVGNLHNPINARFVLNPQQKPQYQRFSPLDWVEQRQPETLLVHCGHNHGLFAFGFEGKDQPSVTQGDHEGLDYFGQWQKVADRLAALPDAVQTIMVVQLPKVSGVAALRPVSDDRANGYALEYEPRVLPLARRLSGTRVAEMDAMILDANERIEKILRDAAKVTGKEARLKFFNAYAALDALDFKNSLKAAKRLKITDQVLVDNRYLDGAPALSFPPSISFKLVAGGYLSIDGMHATGAGYADLASKVTQALGLPHTDQDRANMLSRGFQEDTLLRNYPLELDVLMRLIDLARTLTGVNYFIPTFTDTLADNSHMAVALPMLARTFTR